MSGQRLMCVWQAVFALDPCSKGIAKKKLVQQVTASFTKNPLICFSVREFESSFPGENIDFNKYVEYVRIYLVQIEGTYNIIEQSIENMSWDHSKDFYGLDQYDLDESYMKKLWQVYNRLCDPGTVPPNLGQEEANWIGEKLSAQLGQHWSSANVPHHMCYGELMQTLKNKSFSKASVQAVQNAVDYLYDWFVQEIAMTGWLYKRTRKQANWTSWIRRWFVLTPGQLVYYDNQSQETKRGNIIVNAFTKLEDLPEFQSLAKRYPSRFGLTNTSYIEMELSANYNHERKAWMSAIMEIKDAAKLGTTPVQSILKERMIQKRIGNGMTIDQAISKLRSVRLRDGGSSREHQARPNKKRPMPQKLPLEFDENIKKQVNRIQNVFRNVDTNMKDKLEAFASFRPPGQSGNIVMKGSRSWHGCGCYSW